VLMPYTERSRDNLLREGIPNERIYVTGNPINEVILHYDKSIGQSKILSDLGLEPKRYFLVTMHRAENVDVVERLRGLVEALEQVQKIHQMPVIISTHPRTQARLKDFGFAQNSPLLQFLPPFGFFDFISLERQAFCVLSDSGTVQEECAIFGVPNVTIRDVTERPETIECGSNMLSGVCPEQVLLSVRTVLAQKSSWMAPVEYKVPNVSDTVSKILLGYRWPKGR
jgi:UDP-N-acetylglucosamine 2-epimerase (non-hydrolysing)